MTQSKKQLSIPFKFQVWMEPMPRGDPLAVGFITAVDGAATAPASAVGRRNTWRCLQGWRWLRCRR